MKINLGNFPKQSDYGDAYEFAEAVCKWNHNFEKEIRHEYTFAREQARNQLLTRIFGEILGLKGLDLDLSFIQDNPKEPIGNVMT